MHWKVKSKIQRLASAIPLSYSYPVYYWVQRRFGGLRRVNPVKRFKDAVNAWQLILELGHDPMGKNFLEVGTGRVPTVPLAYWLMGAGKTTTVDVNTYVREELVQEALKYISEQSDEIREVFGLFLDTKRLEKLLSFHGKSTFSLRSFFELCNVNYVSPGDAGATLLGKNSIHFHTSYRVLEHIHPTSLQAIVREGNRIISDNGLFIHRIDYSDHFSHSDKAITAINFLQYSNAEWDRYAGNRYMYMNRMRHDDYLEMFQSMGHKVLITRPDIDQRSLELIESGTFPLAKQFATKSHSSLSIRSSWIVSSFGGT